MDDQVKCWAKKAMSITELRSAEMQARDYERPATITNERTINFKLATKNELKNEKQLTVG